MTDEDFKYLSFDLTFLQIYLHIIFITHTEIRIDLKSLRIFSLNSRVIAAAREIKRNRRYLFYMERLVLPPSNQLVVSHRAYKNYTVLKVYV